MSSDEIRMSLTATNQQIAALIAKHSAPGRVWWKPTSSRNWFRKMENPVNPAIAMKA
jgi:hypothetical protein